MPITFNCGCGKTLRVPDQHAGKRVKCPACNGVALVPEAEPEPMFEVVEDTSEPIASPPPPPKSPVRGKPVVARAAADDDDDDDDRRGYGVSKSRRDDDDEEEERPRPKKKKFKAKRSPSRGGYDRSANNNSTSATREIIGGLIAMVGAAVWFVLGLANDRIYFYPPILFICGLIGLCKGLAGGSGEH